MFWYLFYITKLHFLIMKNKLFLNFVHNILQSSPWANISCNQINKKPTIFVQIISHRVWHSSSRFKCPILVSISVVNQVEKTYKPSKSDYKRCILKTFVFADKQVEFLETCIFVFRNFIGLVLGQKTLFSRCENVAVLRAITALWTSDV